MELKIKPYDRNLFPLGAILVKGSAPAVWIMEMQTMGLSLKSAKVFPVPGTTPNSIWGCFVVPDGKLNTDMAGKHELYQKVAANLYIPEKSVLQPAITPEEIGKLFAACPNMFHPDLGMVELTEELQVDRLIANPVMQSFIVTRPADAVFIPGQVKSFQVHALTPEEMMQEMEEKTFPKQEVIEEKPLSLWEKLKLAVYRKLFTTTERKDAKPVVGRTREMTRLEKFLTSVLKTDNSMFDKMQQEYEDLEQRNKDELQKLFDMLRDNPEEALKYAIPLDDNGSSRGESNGRLDLSKRWNDLSLSGSGTRGSGAGAVNLGDSYHDLRRQYNLTVEALIKQKDYQKAAFVYLKLLKDANKAADTLAAGEHYQEAATIHLKYTGSKRLAADCYRKGKMNHEAIELYKELNEDELVGDLYLEMQQRKEANIYFQKMVEQHKAGNHYLKAAELCTRKMNDTPAAQQLLLEGWRNKIESVSCLKKYFDNIDNSKIRIEELNRIYSKDVGEQNRENFLQVIKHEYQKKNVGADVAKEMAYEIIAAEARKNPSIVGELKSFNEQDAQLVKDTIRFKLSDGFPGASM